SSFISPSFATGRASCSPRPMHEKRSPSLLRSSKPDCPGRQGNMPVRPHGRARPIWGTANSASRRYCSGKAKCRRWSDMGKLIDGDDGLPVEEVGEWVSDKHDLLCDYIQISTYARKKYLPPLGRGGSTCIDLFCGPGRV